jgi:HD superfamily phosphodiesterase
MAVFLRSPGPLHAAALLLGLLGATALGATASQDTAKAAAPADWHAAVRGAIRTHMYYRDPAGPEALYLHDADALDWLGAIGAARIFGLVDTKGGKPDGPQAVKMLEELRRESDNLQTL